MTKIFNFALKIKEGGREGGTCEVLLPCQPPPPPENLKSAQNLKFYCCIFENSSRQRIYDIFNCK